MDTSQWLPFKLESDDRQPFATISLLPLYDCQLAMYAPSILFWVQTLVAVGMVGVVAGVLSIVVYITIIKKQGSTMAFLIGYGVLLPLWLILPFYIIELLDLRNVVMKFAVGAIHPTLGIFKTTEAMYGCAPAHTTTSISSYILYWCSPMMLVYDDKHQHYVTCTFRDTLWQLANFGYKLSILGAIQSVATPSSLHLFGSHSTSEWYDPARLLDPKQYMDNLVWAYLFQMYLSSYCEGMIAVTMFVTGLKCEIVMENPLMQSKSLQDLWSKKWNRLVEGVLKRGVYIPLRKSGFPQLSASLGTFLASGIMHEWLLLVLFTPMKRDLSPDGTCESCYVAPLGGQTAFMLWNAVAIMVESKLGTSFQNMLPAGPIRTFLVIAPGVMVAHWFVDPYVMSNTFFAHGQLSLPMILPYVVE